MSSLLNKILLFVFLVSGLFADCELIEDNRFEAYEQFKKAQSLHDGSEHSDAYDMLLKSYESYSGSSSEIELEYTCVNYIPGPYAPTIQRSSKRETFDFDRKSLGISIKHQLSPAPYVFVQFQKNKTLVSAVNSVKTSRNTIQKRLPLENFVVRIDSDKFDFKNLVVDKPVTLSKNRRHHINSSITTAEDFGFKLYK